MQKSLRLSEEIFVISFDVFHFIHILMTLTEQKFKSCAWICKNICLQMASFSSEILLFKKNHSHQWQTLQIIFSGDLIVVICPIQMTLFLAFSVATSNNFFLQK